MRAINKTSFIFSGLLPIMLLIAIDLPSFTNAINLSLFVSEPNIVEVLPLNSEKEIPKSVAVKKSVTPNPKAKNNKSKITVNTKDKIDYSFLDRKIEKRIMTYGNKNAEQLSSFLMRHNSRISKSEALLMATYYIDESESEGVNHDIAFCQMCLETGFLRFGGVVSKQQNNFCGLGAIRVGKPGENFSTKQLGVRAHIQHLKAYGSDDPLNGQLIDRRFKWVKRGISPTVDGLSGKWAADREYAYKIKNLLLRLDVMHSSLQIYANQ